AGRRHVPAGPAAHRDEQFVRAYQPIPLDRPTAEVVVVTCLDHRVDPALFLGLQLGVAPVIRNATGRVTTIVEARYRGQ
ncbi:MAG TPA: hypothetical protein VKV06_15030, partial [Acidimicrobiales bacterium]|nr:hypothetical protein [Acidimicrobiales bacterium]